MPRGRKAKDETTTRSRRPPAKTPEAREQQLMMKAMDLAERQIDEGTASSQTINHFLKMASSREVLEKERLKNENILLQARAAQIESAAKMEELYEVAIAAMRSYAGQDPIDITPEDDYAD